MWDPLVISGNKWPKAQQGAQGMGGPSASRRRIPPFIFTHLPTRLPNSLTKSHLSEEAMVNSILLNYISPAIWLCPGLLWRVKVCPSQESIWYTFGVYQEIYSFGLISEALRRKKVSLASNTRQSRDSRDCCGAGLSSVYQFLFNCYQICVWPPLANSV